MIENPLCAFFFGRLTHPVAHGVSNRKTGIRSTFYIDHVYAVHSH